MRIPADGDGSYYYSIKQSTCVLFPFFCAFFIWLVMFAMYVSCSFVSYLHACYVCKCMFHILTFLSQSVGGSGVELSA